MTKGLKIRVKKLGFVVKHHHPEAAAFALHLARFALEKGITVYFADESRPIAKNLIGSLKNFQTLPKNKVKVVPKNHLVDVTDLILVLGGDGTFLSIARLMKAKSVPVMGINMGQLGFLTEIKKSEAIQSLAAILAGKPAQVHERALFEVSLKRNGRVVFQGPVVNDAVISKGAIARIIEMQINVNGKWVQNVRADGIIVSTPTGSTAYALAVGGPIMEPSLRAMIIASISPHSLTQRPLVIPDTSEVQIKLSELPGHVFLTLDGQDAFDMKAGDVVTIRTFKKHSLRLISSPDRDYFSLLREKLKFGVRD